MQLKFSRKRQLCKYAITLQHDKKTRKASQRRQHVSYKTHIKAWSPELVLECHPQPNHLKLITSTSMIKSQSSLGLFCTCLGLRIHDLQAPRPLRSLQLSDYLPLPKCSQPLDLERGIDEPCKQSKPHKEILNKVGSPWWEGRESSLDHHHLLPSLTSTLPMSADSLRKRLWHLSISSVLQPPWTLGNKKWSIF